MRRITGLILSVAIAAGASLFVVPLNTLPAEAGSRPVYVSTYGIPADWQVNAAMNWVDQYTGSDMVRAVCPAKSDCIKIVNGTVKTSDVGWTSKSIHRQMGSSATWQIVTITIDLAKAKRSGKYTYATKRWLIEHELGHANGAPHTTACRTMFRYNRCSSGKLPTRGFSSGERVILRRN